MTQRALKGDYGATQARSAFRRIMDGDVPRSLKVSVKKYYENGGDSPKHDSGIWHTLTHNPVTDAVGKGMMLIDKPKRAIIASIDESLQAIQGDSGGDKGSWFDHVFHDKAYGGGDLVRHAAQIDKNKGTDIPWLDNFARSKWGGRVLGLGTDVALDPLTYLSGGVTEAAAKGTKAVQGADLAAKTAAEASARDVINAAARDGVKAGSERATIDAADTAIAASRRSSKARELTRTQISQKLAEAGLTDVAQKVARRGASAASSAELEAAGLKGGLKFLGHDIPGVGHNVTRLPGLPLGAAKAAAFDSKAGTVLGLAFGDDKLAELRQVIRSKTSAPEDVQNAIKGVRALKSARLSADRMEQKYAGELNRLLSRVHQADLPTDTVYKALTDPSGDAAALLDNAVPNGTAHFRSWLDRLPDTANDLAGANDAGGKAFLQKVDNYFPRQPTEEAQAALDRTARGAGGPMQRSSAEFHRLKEGDQLLGETLGSAETAAKHGATVDDQINSILSQKLGLQGDWFNKNALETLPRYLKGVAKRTHEEGYLANLRRAGVIDPSEAVAAVGDIRAEAAQKLAEAQALDAAAAERGAATKAAENTPRRSVKTDIAPVSLQTPEIAPGGPFNTLVGRDTPTAPQSLTERLRAPTGASERVAAVEAATERLRAAQGLRPEQPLNLAGFDSVGHTVNNLAAKVEDLKAKIASVQAAGGSERRLAEMQANASTLQKSLGEQRSLLQDVQTAQGATPPGVANPLPQMSTSEMRGALGGTDSAHAAAVGGTPPNPSAAHKSLAEITPQYDQLQQSMHLARGDAGATMSRLEAKAQLVESQLGHVAGQQSAKAEGLHAAQQELQLSADLARTATTASDTAVKDAAALESSAAELRAQSLALGERAVTTEQAISVLRGPRGQAGFSQMVSEAMQTLGRENLLTAPPWMIDAFTKTAHAAKEPGVFLKWFDAANRGFKTYAILSPGFHVRNSMGAFFMNFVAGAEIASYREMGAAMRQFRRGGLEAVSEEMRPYVARLYEGGLMTDGNRVSAEVGSMATGEGGRLRIGDGGAVEPGDSRLARYKKTVGGRLGPTDNPATRLSRLAGDRIEDYHRAVLAYDVMKKGGTYDDAVEKVYQFHFDYSDLSDKEKTIGRRIVPFWTWTSRNMPLQIEQLYRHPRMYERFNQLRDNLSRGNTSDPLAPSYLSDSVTAIKMGGNNILTPNLPFENVDTTLQTFAQNPIAGIFENAAPILKTPLELQAGKQFFEGVPISAKLQPLPGAWAAIPGLKQALQLGGFVTKDRKGNLLVSGSTAYSVEQALPLLGRARRLFPSSSDSGGKFHERRNSALLSFFGIGDRTVSERDRQNEVYRRADALKAAADRLKNQGYVMGKPKKKATTRRRHKPVKVAPYEYQAPA